jgi:hypothetical protein
MSPDSIEALQQSLVLLERQVGRGVKVWGGRLGFKVGKIQEGSWLWV